VYHPRRTLAETSTDGYVWERKEPRADGDRLDHAAPASHEQIRGQRDQAGDGDGPVAERIAHRHGTLAVTGRAAGIRRTVPGAHRIALEQRSRLGDHAVPQPERLGRGHEVADRRKRMQVAVHGVDVGVVQAGEDGPGHVERTERAAVATAT